MPWTAADMAKKKEGLSGRAAGVAATVANKALASCLDKIKGTPSDEQRSRCEASAIKQGLAVSGRMGESMGLAELARVAIETALAAVNGSDWLAEEGETEKEAANRILNRLRIELNKIAEATTKTVSGRTHDRGDFLVVGDADEPTTWALPVKVRGKPDHRLMGGAWAALHQGYRGNKYEGPGKQAALAKLKALYKAEDMPIPVSGEQSEADAEAVVTPQQVKAVLKYLWARVVDEEEEEAPSKPAVPERGAEEAETETAEMAEVELSESASGQIVGLAEEDIADRPGPRSPLAVNIRVMRPGWGNAKDNHYYPAETIVRDIHVFEGLKMYTTDHKADEKKEPTEVAVVEKCPSYFEEDGSAVARVIIFDPAFAEKTRNRAVADKLHTLECSIVGTGKVRNGEVDGRKGKIVEAITVGQGIDWVTRGGAGGRALNLAESEDQSNSGGDSDMAEEHKEKEQVEESQTEEQVTEVVLLSETAVAAILDEATLPDAAKTRLKAAEYENEEAVKGAVSAEVKYLQEITGAGKPLMHGDRETVQDEPMSEAEDNAAVDKIRAAHGLAPLYGGD